MASAVPRGCYLLAKSGGLATAVFPWSNPLKTRWEAALFINHKDESQNPSFVGAKAGHLRNSPSCLLLEPLVAWVRNQIQVVFSHQVG